MKNQDMPRARFAIVFLMLTGLPTALVAQQPLSRAVESLATQIADKAREAQKKKIAVLPFQEIQGRTTVLGSYLAEDLGTRLFDLGSFEIVERAMLDRLLGEIKLGQSGVIDPETAKEVGKVAGVDAVVTGTLVELSTQVAVNARLIDVETGRVLAAAQIKITKDDDVRAILGEASESPSPSGDSRSVAQPSPATSSEAREQEFSFALRGCYRSGSSVRCEVMITNQGETRDLYLTRARMFDDAGNEWPATLKRASRASRSFEPTPAETTHFVSGVPVRTQVYFDGVPPQTTKVVLLEMPFRLSGGYGQVRFRNITFTER